MKESLSMNQIQGDDVQKVPPAGIASVHKGKGTEKHKYKVILTANHSTILDPLGQPKVTAGRDHYFRTCCPSVRPYVRTSLPTFQNLAKQKQSENNVRYWRHYGSDFGSDRVDH